MIRRALAILLVVGAAAGAWLATSASKEADGPPSFWAELDNAFGLDEGGDLKIAGVRAGTITALRLDERTHRALVRFRVDENGFGSLRTDTTCASKPQSLIGEYFLDCDPGTARTALKRGATIPIARTSSTIPPDLVNDILRRPQRERLSLIISALGAGVAGNAESLNAAIRRASPALRETDRVLRILADQNQVLADLTTNADIVLKDLAGNREDVGRWVVDTRDAAAASAERRDAIAAGLRRLPTFLAELTPTMRDLGAVADAQGSALRDLNLSADELQRFFDELGPFANASRPALKSLGEASRTGSEAVTAATPTVDELKTFSAGVPELGKNLAMVLEHLNDPEHAVQDDPRAARQTGRPAPTGYTGLEALLQYVFDQTLAINVFDQNSHLLALAIFPGGHCADYADVERAKKYGAECSSTLGPNQPGITTPDPTSFGGGDKRGSEEAAKKGDGTEAILDQLPVADAVRGDHGDAPKPAVPQAGDGGGATPPALPPIQLPALPQILPNGDVQLPAGAQQIVPGASPPAAAPADKQAQTTLLDYLLGS